MSLRKPRDRGATGPRVLALLLAFTTLLPPPARGGQLGDFEHEVERPRSADRSRDGDDDCDGFLDCLVQTLLSGIAEALVRGAGAAAGEAVDYTLFGSARHDDREWLGTLAGTPAPGDPVAGGTSGEAIPGAGSTRAPGPESNDGSSAPTENGDRSRLPGATNRLGREREAGSPTVPWVRVDNSYLLVPDDVDGYALEARAGYGAFATRVEVVRFWEDRPADRLDSYAADALFRFATGQHVELGLAIGYRGLHGERSHDGWEIGVPISLYPWRYVGLETAFDWAFIDGNVIEDFQGGVALHLPFVTLRPGYRHLETGRETLNGPEITLGVMW